MSVLLTCALSSPSLSLASTATSTATATEPTATEPTAKPAPKTEGEESSMEAAAPPDETQQTSNEHGFGVFGIDVKGVRIKPVLQLSSALVVYWPSRAGQAGNTLATRASTLLLSRFGLEGALSDWIRFQSIFERNLGFAFERNGPIGTSIWEGTASFQARENFIQLTRWGFELRGGIIQDPASVDFVSNNVVDMFGMDPYVRTPLLASGANQGQGFLVRYSRWGATVGMGFTGGNPLVSSLSSGFGGQVSSLGSLYSAPVRAMSSGLPGSDIHVLLFFPSLQYENDWVNVRVGAQLYHVDVDATGDADKNLSGFNVRGTAEVTPFGEWLRVFVSGAYRVNQQISPSDASVRLPNKYFGAVFGGGFDISHGDLSVGGQYHWLRGEASPGRALFTHFASAGGTYWIWGRSVAAGLRWSYSEQDSEDATVPNLLRTQCVSGSLRLLI
ncbi:MAG: hypothetical protein H6729_14470 [Deltaproteobacteria bacterium]|nr:hypothetical protein [Deltaproteobacteria bacterium]